MQKITIGIPAYNAHQTIEKTLISISAFVDTSIIKVIVVDDGSNDHYDNLIEPFLKWIDITLIRLESNSGPGVARNKILSETLTPYITFIDSDDVFIDSFFVREAVTALDQDCSQAIYMTPFLEERADTLETVNSFNWLFGKVYRTSFLNENTITFPERFFDGDINEDFEFSFLTYYMQDNQIIFVDKPSYLYKDRDNSLVRSGDRKTKLMQSMPYGISIKERLLSEVVRLNPERLAQEMKNDIAIFFGYISAIENMSNNPTQDIKQFISSLKKFVDAMKQQVVFFNTEEEYQTYQAFVAAMNPVFCPKTMSIVEYLNQIGFY